MKINAWFAIGFALLTQPVLANGGGYFRGGIERAGDVAGFEPEETGKIRILDERLTVALGLKSADVEVRYLMRNETDKKVKVRFGFPVEESFDNDMMAEGGETDPKYSKRGDGKLKYCQNYMIAASGRSVATKWQGEEKASDDKRFIGIAGWLISELTFASKEEKSVMIRFKSGYPSEEWSVSDDTFAGAALFKYRLSTAVCWSGTIGSGKIILKPNGISPADLRVLKPANRFKKDGSNWVWDFEDLEPSLADDLEIEAVPQEKTFMRPLDAEQGFEGPMATYIEHGSQWSMSHTNYNVSADSTLPADGDIRYDAGQVKQCWDDQAWSEGTPGPGIGEWLELKPVVPKPLTAISIFPGYRKSDELFKANARPKKILVELDDAHRFHVDVPDSSEEFRIPVTGYSKAVRTIRITFEDVWKGTRFEDLCVSGMSLHVKLDKNPKIQPAR